MKLLFMEIKRELLSKRWFVCLAVLAFSIFVTTGNMHAYEMSAGNVHNAWDVFLGIFGNYNFFPGFIFPILLVFWLGDSFIADSSTGLNHLIQLRLKERNHYWVAKTVSILICIAVFVCVVFVLSIALGAIRGFPAFPARLSKFGMLQDGWVAGKSVMPVYNAFSSRIDIVTYEILLLPYYVLVYSGLILLAIVVTLRSRQRFAPLGIMFLIVFAQFVFSQASTDAMADWSTLSMLTESSHRSYAVASAGIVPNRPVPWSCSIALAGAIFALALFIGFFQIRSLTPQTRKVTSKNFQKHVKATLGLFLCILFCPISLAGCTSASHLMAPLPQYQITSMPEIAVPKLTGDEVALAQDIAVKTIELGESVMRLQTFLQGTNQQEYAVDGYKRLQEVVQQSGSRIAALRSISMPPSLEEWNSELFSPGLSRLELALGGLPSAYRARDYRNILKCFNEIAAAGDYFSLSGQLLDEAVESAHR